MKRLKILSIALCTLALPTLAVASSWSIDPDHSNAGFKVQHLMISNVRGNFPDVQGTVQIDDANITLSTVEITIAAASLDTNQAKRDAHLKSADFFDIEKYPTLTFKSKRVLAGENNTLTVIGDLTLHGVTREVTLQVEGPSPEAKDPWGNIRKGAEATTTIDRKDFGLVYNAALESGGVLIGDEVEIHIEVELIKKGG